MDNLTIKIKNCYGINNFENEFDFSKGKSTQIIYAPNGVMKTSFANVFDDYSKGIESSDLIYPHKHSFRQLMSNNHEIPSESIFVIRPYDKSYKSDKISTLLVNEELRREYDEIHKQLAIEKESLLELLKVPSGLKKDIEEELCDSFDEDKNNLVQLLYDIEGRVTEPNDFDYSHITYKKIFSEKVINFLETEDIKRHIKDYIEKYDELISKSDILNRSFNHYHATTVQKNLENNGFFKANHSINLNIDGQKKEINNPREFLNIIKSAKEKILQDKTLQTLFEKIDKKISNTQLRDFRDYLFENQEILTELSDLDKFKQKLWISYISNYLDEYRSLIGEYKKGQTKIKEIISKAKSQKTDWENVIEIFNSRFYVPYRIRIQNKEDSVLNEAAPNIEYYFEESDQVDEELLLKVLSQGEQRTLYLLNIIFEIESRKKQGLETLFIIDDIADSFDYKNKYAIIEYLKDVTKHDGFKSIILTHNFDFFRTVQERVSGNAKYRGAYMALKEDDNIKLERFYYSYIKDPLKYWKKNLDDPKILIASVTFARNIADYIGRIDIFTKLTSILHLKETTFNITIGDLEEIYKSIFEDLGDLNLLDKQKTIYDLIFEVVSEIINSQTEFISNIENKVVMSIAIRLNAEKYMINKINDDDFVSRIKKNQTGCLFGKYKNKFPENTASIKVLERVNIMTPENIHLNSFMFEPILDMSDHHLKQLYNDVLELIKNSEEHANASTETTAQIT